MINRSRVKKVKLGLQAAARLAERSRRGQAALSGARATAGIFRRVLRQLWLEVTGFTFLALAAVGAMAGMREYGKYQSGHAPGPGRLLLAVCFTASFAWFGLSSFLRVNKRASKQRN